MVKVEMIEKLCGEVEKIAFVPQGDSYTLKLNVKGEEARPISRVMYSVGENKNLCQVLEKEFIRTNDVFYVFLTTEDTMKLIPNDRKNKEDFYLVEVTVYYNDGGRDTIPNGKLIITKKIAECDVNE